MVAIGMWWSLVIFFLIVLSVGGSRRPEGQGKEENGGVTV